MAYNYMKQHAIESGEIDGVEYLVLPHPCADRGIGGLNGYVCFKEKPVKEQGDGGILAYVPVHGGITYSSHEDGMSVYGFDTGHCDSDEYPIRSHEWIKEQCAIMARAIRLAASLEDEYLLAEGDNEKRADICQRVLDVQPQSLAFGVMINLLRGRL